MATVRLTPETVFARDYRVVRPLAEGGMGAVYVVEQLSTSEARALKIMHPSLVGDASSRARFDREARVSGQIASQHAVKVIAAGVDEPTGTPWICMELLEGEDLAARFERLGAMDRETTRLLFLQICHALELAHRRGIVHRDLKPENIFLSKPLGPGTPFTAKVLDFGIAKMFDEARATQPTAAIGTPLWMAPEQADPHARISPTTDVWALGLIAFQALTGRVFWKSGNVPGAGLSAVLTELITAPIPPASVRARELLGVDVLPAGFDEFFARCVDRSPEARLPDAGAARDALFATLDAGPSIPATGPISGTPPVSAFAPTAGASAIADSSPRSVAAFAATVGAGSPAHSVAATAPLHASASPAATAPLHASAATASLGTASAAGASPARRSPVAVIATAALGLLALAGCIGVAGAMWAFGNGYGVGSERPSPSLPGAGTHDPEVTNDDGRCARTSDCADPMRERCSPVGRCMPAVHWAELRVSYEGQPERRLRSTTMSSYHATSQGSWLTFTYGPAFLTVIIPTGTRAGPLPLDSPSGGAMVMLSDNDIAIPADARGNYNHESGTVTITHIDERPGGSIDGTIDAVLRKVGGGRSTATLRATFHAELTSAE